MEGWDELIAVMKEGNMGKNTVLGGSRVGKTATEVVRGNQRLTIVDEMVTLAMIKQQALEKVVKFLSMDCPEDAYSAMQVYKLAKELL